MKKLFKNLFISLFATTLVISLGVAARFIPTKENIAKAEGTYTLIEENNGLDFSTTAFNATVKLAVDNYAVQDGDYLALDMEGYVSGGICMKVGLNGDLVAVGADFVTLPSISHVYNWSGDLKYGHWLFSMADGRGTAFIKISEYFPTVTNINSLDILFADNKLESFTLHAAYVTKDTTARNGTDILNVFDGSGNLNNAKVTNVSGVNVTARKTARGFQTNKALTGAVSVTMPQTHIEINLDDTVDATGGGYLAYDVRKSTADWIYFRLALENTASASFNANYYEVGKTLSSNGTLNYTNLTTLYGWYYTDAAISGTVLERLQTATGVLHKIIIDCDNICAGELVLSNFYFISSDFATITPLVDLANMSAADRQTNINSSSTAKGFAVAFNRSAFTCDETGANKPAFKDLNDDTKWSWALLAEQYDNLLSTSEKDILVNGTSEDADIVAALARYDYIVNKYYVSGLDTTFDDFIGRNPSSISASNLIGSIKHEENTIILVVGAIIVSISLFSCAFAIKNKKKKEG